MVDGLRLVSGEKDMVKVTAAINQLMQNLSSSGTGGGSVSGLRPTLTAGTPVTESDITGATSIVCMMQQAGTTIYNGTIDTGRTYIGDITVTLDSTNALSGTNFDLYEFWDSSSSQVLVGYISWLGGSGGSDTARGTGAGGAACHFFNGRLTNIVQVTLRTDGSTTFTIPADQANLIGGFRTIGMSGQTEDSMSKRFLWSLYYPVVRPLRRADTTASWVYTSTTIRQANGSAANQVEWFHGVSGRPVILNNYGMAFTSNASPVTAGVGIGIDSTVANSAHVIIDNALPASTGAPNATIFASYDGFPGIGYHKGCMLESGNTSVTFLGNEFASAIGRQTGMVGWSLC